ncbi:MAG: glycosyltransferase, partial [Candidatus Poseidoniaceae archaeon]
GRELETRGWVVGITTLKQQPRDLVWDRMMVADLTIITSKRESGPMVAKESILCGTPVVSVDVGDVSEWLPNEFISASREAQELADKCEHALQFDWKNLDFQLPDSFSRETISSQWEDLLLRFS